MESNRGLDLEKELTCSICTEVLYQPLTLLDCLHSFCGSCLKEWFSWQFVSSRNAPNSIPPGSTPYTCPSCRAHVRDTQYNSTITTLLEMLVVANPGKGKTASEKADIAKKYKPGNNVLPKVDQKEKSLHERRVDDEDRALINDIRDLSLREVGIGGSGAGRERRRREEERPRNLRTHSSQNQSRESRSTEDRERRHRRENHDRRRRDEQDSRPENSHSEDQRRRRSEERRREEETSQSAARQIEHQSSIRSLISSSDLDSSEIEEEILRQIREENLLEGVDLDNIDVSQEDQISERIAEAFRRRQGERSRQEPTRRSDASGRRRQPRSSAPDLRESSDDSSRTSRGRRTNSTSPMATSTNENEPSRPPLSTSSSLATHLEVNSTTSDRRRRRTASRSRSSTAPVPVAEVQALNTARSQTNLGSGSRNLEPSASAASRPLISGHRRNNTDPSVAQAAQMPASDQSNQAQRASTSRSPRTRHVVEYDEASTPVSIGMSTRAVDNFVPSSAPSAVSPAMDDPSLYPAPVSPRPLSLISDKAIAISSGTRPISSSSATLRRLPQLYPEPNLSCARCSQPHIEYELHYNCAICRGGNWNICLSCYRSRRGCLHWFGFGAAAWDRWEALIQSGDLSAGTEQPHMLTANRYVQPKASEGGADGRRTLTTEDPKKRLQSGTFCASCFAWANECYWRCDVCNEGDWGFCNLCVNRGKSCTNPLLPLVYKPSESSSPPLTPNHEQQTPASATILTGPGVLDIGPFKPLTFHTKCDVCHYPIQPSSTRYHCFSCTSAVPNTHEGDYDICNTCYPKLVASRRISFENGHNGWRRCLQGHRMVILGFEDSNGGQRRVIVRDLVGGRGVHEEPFTSVDHPGADLQKWSWGDAPNTKVKPVTTDVMKTAPTYIPGIDIEKEYPPDGGVGMHSVATWSWYPEEDATDELLFPKDALVMECKNVNGDWFHGTYMGSRGLFPSNYVKVLDEGVV